MDGKDCLECRNFYRIQLGPHLWVNKCQLEQADFPFSAMDCAFYQPDHDAKRDDENERWPCRPSV